MMNTREVAEYLRIKERKVYDLVRERRIPCTRVTGKWLFPRNLIDLWIAEGTEFPGSVRTAAQPPPVVVGSHDPLLEWSLRESGCALALLAGGSLDPLLEWSLRESGCALALLAGGSLDGVGRFAAGEAAVCGLHVLDPAGAEDDDGRYNMAIARDSCRGLGVVLVEWAWRDQGLVLAPGNPLGIRTIGDLKTKGARVVARQNEAGSRVLFEHLLGEAGIALTDLDVLAQPARSETDLGLGVLEGKADAGLGVAEVAHRYRLDFVALHRGRYDLMMRRRDYFEPPIQALLTFTRTAAFTARATEMEGYDVANLGRVVWNEP